MSSGSTDEEQARWQASQARHHAILRNAEKRLQKLNAAHHGEAVETALNNESSDANCDCSLSGGDNNELRYRKLNLGVPVDSRDHRRELKTSALSAEDSNNSCFESSNSRESAASPGAQSATVRGENTITEERHILYDTHAPYHTHAASVDDTIDAKVSPTPDRKWSPRTSTLICIMTAATTRLIATSTMADYIFYKQSILPVFIGMETIVVLSGMHHSQVWMNQMLGSAINFALMFCGVHSNISRLLNRVMNYAVAIVRDFALFFFIFVFTEILTAVLLYISICIAICMAYVNGGD